MRQTKFSRLHLSHTVRRWCVFLLTAAMLLLTGCSMMPSFLSEDDPAFTTPVNTATQTEAVTEAVASSVPATETAFVMDSGGCQLDAVFTGIDDGEKHTTVLLIADTGAYDCDESVGAWKPFADIARGLGANGIQSLRMDKRSAKQSAPAAKTDGIEEEYLIDCRNALTYLAGLPSVGDVYLLGHGLGGQIATELAKENAAVRGLILFASSPRNLAEVLYDQYVAADPNNIGEYTSDRNSILRTTTHNAWGAQYYGVYDYYWASLNEIDAVQNISDAAVPVLILNSSFDRQCFQEDIEQWGDSLAGVPNIQFLIDDKINHFGYEVDTTNQSVYLNAVDFPDRLINQFVSFLRTSNP